MSESNRWFDELGACKVCGGEIPHGHVDDCDIWKLEQQVSKLNALIGQPPEGSHPDEWKPRAETWHHERLNWQAEVERLRSQLSGQRAAYHETVSMPSEDTERYEEMCTALERISRACDEEMRLPYYRDKNPPAVLGAFAAIKGIADAARGKERK